MAGSSNVRLPRVAAVWVAPSWLAVALSVLVVTSPAWAGDECQEIQLDGVAGGSGSSVVIRVVDASPGGGDPLVQPSDVITESCALLIAPGEPAAQFIRRVPGFWGNGNGGTPADDPDVNLCKRTCTAGKDGTTSCTVNKDCDNDPNDGLGICGLQPKKNKCSNLPENDTKPSCSIEAKVTQVKGKCLGGTNNGASCSTNSQCPGGECPGAGTLRSCDGAAPDETCTKKRTIKICCRALGCSGAKLAGEGVNIPITVQTKITPGTPDCSAGEWCPAEIPGDNIQALRFKADPIDGRPGPYTSQRECRSTLQTKAGALTQTVFDVLKACRQKVIAGTLPPGSCAAVSPTSDPGSAVAAAGTALATAIADGCALSGRSPSDFGYTACAAPCDAIELAVCSAGTVGAPCQRDRHCDTSPGVGNGVCGDWNTFKDCTVCSATAAGEAAIDAVYGSVGRSLTRTASAKSSSTAGAAATAAADGNVGRSLTLSASAKNCQNHIGDGIATLLAAELKDAASCQKSLDAFKIMLSDRTPKCKDADHKRKRAKARAAIAVDLASACTNAALGELDTCSSNRAGLLACAPRIVRHVVAAVGDTAAPDGRCGDGKQGIGETCDDGNTIDGDGCDSNCTFTACGNGVISTGEECDDGNTIAGDSCSPACLSEQQACSPQMCSNFDFDCSKLFPGDCVCLHAAGGGGSCVNNFNCATATTCDNSYESPCPDGKTCCPSGETCYLDTCCPTDKAGICGPQKCTAP